jgi:hypothetical protein
MSTTLPSHEPLAQLRRGHGDALNEAYDCEGRP